MLRDDTLIWSLNSKTGDVEWFRTTPVGRLEKINHPEYYKLLLII